MAASSAQTIDVEMQRAELKSVLASREFLRAPRLADFLSYLCEKLFGGEANQIKEYSIGLDVFRRGASFDQDSDSIVRVEANRLRKRLADYYAGEGASHLLQITIPLGQYVPHFEPRIPAGKLGAAIDIRPASRPIYRKRWVAFAVAGLICAAAIAGGLYWRRSQQRTVAETASIYVQPGSTEGQFGPPVGQEIRILAGEGRSLVDHAGKLWSADTGFTGGTSVKIGALHIGRTLDPGFYRTSRQGQFRYDIPLKSGIYELRLHFAETVYGPEMTGTGGEGSRLMTVKANGQTLVTHFDVIGDAGASGVADVKVFSGISPAQDGMLHLEFAGEDGKEALLSAIEILPGIAGHIRPLRILARQSPYYSNDSYWWSPDSYFEGGQLASYAQEVSGTDDPELYGTERWGNFSYAIPVTPGRYTVVLHFAARHGSPGETGADTAAHGAHIFNVFCNGRALLENFDLAREAGKQDVVIRRFADLEPNAQGKLVLSFVPVSGYAALSGIEVLPVGRE
jgi:hypothetical protein